MGDAGWWLIIGLVALVDPVVVGVGVLTGLFARRWLHAILSVIVAPVGFWGFYSAFYRSDHFWPLFPSVAVAGLTWSGATFAVKRALQT